MPRLRLIALALAATLSTGCYRVTVVAGDAPAPVSAPTVDTPWAHGFVLGLVPPAAVSTEQKCKDGVHQVMTQRSFLNGLVNAITYNLYTPMQITATCASAGRQASLMPQPDSAATLGAAIVATSTTRP
ncbi:MAG TPA: hypothetical protein VHQ45_18020 [Gemmatimonadaceae bacterium]|nr:hypothetical protein [Gemmatimonadaceae bacterium]